MTTPAIAMPRSTSISAMRFEFATRSAVASYVAEPVGGVSPGILALLSMNVDAGRNLEVIRSACYVHTPMSPIQSDGAHPDTHAAAVAVRSAYLPALEGIRGLAVLLVVLSHMSSSDVFLERSINFRGL